MLKIFKRNRHVAPVTADHDPLAIRNLLDDPRLQAVMAAANDAANEVAAEATPVAAGPRPERAMLGAAA